VHVLQRVLSIYKNYTNYSANETHYCPLDESVWIGMDWTSTSWFFCQFSQALHLHIILRIKLANYIVNDTFTDIHSILSLY